MSMQGFVDLENSHGHSKMFGETLKKKFGKKNSRMRTKSRSAVDSVMDPVNRVARKAASLGRRRSRRNTVVRAGGLDGNSTIDCNVNIDRVGNAVQSPY